MPGVSNLALQSKIEGLEGKIDDVKKLLTNNEERIRCLERAGDSTRPVYEKRIELLEKLTNAHAEELESLKDLINTQAQSIEKLTNGVDSMRTIWKWALGIFTTVIVAIIIMFLTGQATVIFK